MKVFISVENLKSNLRSVRNNLLSRNISVAAVVKGNAYGHGLEHVVPSLHEMGIFFFVVYDIVEARRVSCFVKNSDILITQTCVQFCEDDFYNSQFVYTLSSFEVLDSLLFQAKKRQRPVRVHIKIDTGLSRLGFLSEEVSRLIFVLKDNPWICVEGIFSHLAVSNVPDSPYSEKQEKLFLRIIAQFSSQGFSFKHIHLCNSMSLLNRVQNTAYTLVRLGGLLYGVLSSEAVLEKIKLKAVMTIKTTVLSVKTIPKGSFVGYDKKYVADKTMRIAVIDAGYAHGMSYFSSQSGIVLINGQKRPIVGVISMQMTMIHLDEDDCVSCGDEVVLIGNQGQEVIRVESVAKKLGTAPYDLLCKMGVQCSVVEKNFEINDNKRIEESENDKINRQCLR